MDVADDLSASVSKIVVRPNQQQLLLVAPKAEPQSVEVVTNGQAQTPNGAASEWPERRRWWQRVLWG